ncbi:MAG: response regulator [Chloroflexi bacterium]|nr:response regulator [Chloroflexota bacterium]
MPKILLIEDDPLIVSPIKRALVNIGFEVLAAYDGEKGLALALEQQPDLVILDILLPVMDGWAVCKGLRARSSVPILMLTALGEEVDRILGLELGADDYLTKPFSTRELLARVKALLRRVELDMGKLLNSHRIKVRGIEIDLDKRQTFKNGTLLDLRYKEFELLSLLVANAGEVVTRAEIFDKVWGTDWLGDMRTLDVHIRWLREKIETDAGNPDYIQTVRGVGYRFAPG